MISMNETLLPMLLGALLPEKKLLPKLMAIVDDGFVEHKSSSIFLKACLPHSESVDSEQFQDLTGFECFVNSVHIDELTSEDLVVQGVLFARALRNRWKFQIKDRKCVAILSASSDSTVVKLHTWRAGERWLDPDVDSYSDAVFLWE